MKELQKRFDNRESLIAYVKGLAAWAQGDCSTIEGTRQHPEWACKDS